MNITIRPLPETYLSRVREDGIDALGQPVERLIAAGGEPLRDVLRRARAGEALILASYSPFDQIGPYREFGAVFVLAEASGEAVDYTRLPTSDGTADAYFREHLALRAYSPDQRIIDARLIRSEEIESTVEALLSRTDSAYVHARFPAYGCFACRIDRAA